jgi:hypothetical protein
MSQELGAFGLLGLGPFSLGARFGTYEPFISLIFQFSSGRDKSRVLNQWIRGHTCNLKSQASKFSK